MAKLIIEGGHALKGQIAVRGAKNAALPILAAAMLVPEPVRIGNCPRLTDVEHMLGLLRALGCRADWGEDGLVIDAGGRKRWPGPSAPPCFCWVPSSAALGRRRRPTPGAATSVTGPWTCT